MPVNVRLLRLEVAKQAEPQIRAQIDKIVKLDYKTKKEQFFEDFESHPVTQEIEEGPTALSSYIPGGNLFSLLGFYKEQKPVQALRDYLKRTIKVGDTRPGKRTGETITFETPVEMPTLGDIDQHLSGDPQSKLDWDERSFTQLIRRGISGLPYYLFSLVRDFSKVPSRSGTAIQTKGSALRSGSVGPIKYVDELLARFRARINGGR